MNYSNQQDVANKSTWKETSDESWLSRLQGFVSEGERACYFDLIDEFRAQPILEIGVGPGRTLPLMRGLTSELVAIDYVDKMVELACARYPKLDIRKGDARNLSSYSDGQFSLVTFSFMGLDALDHEGRRAAISEILRVLRPGGAFWFSTLNKRGSGPRRRPWSYSERHHHGAHFILQYLRWLRSVPNSTKNFLRLKKHREEHAGWMIDTFYPHDYSLLVHYVDLDYEIEELRQLGFTGPMTIYRNSDGKRTSPADHNSDEEGFNLIARKPISEEQSLPAR